MDAIMTSLVAVLLANADGRAGARLARLLAVHGGRPIVGALAIAAVALNAFAAALAGTIVHRMVDPRVAALLVALALGGAAAGLLWRRGAAAADARLAAVPLPLLAPRLLFAEAGGRNPVLIGAFAAASGAGLWAAAGGVIGWLLAVLPFLALGPSLADRRAASAIRWAGAGLLALWGVAAGLRAFGLLG